MSLDRRCIEGFAWHRARAAIATCALVLCWGPSWAQEIAWHLNRVDGALASPSAINTAGQQAGPRRIVVAVIDSGVIASHPGLKGRVLPGYDMVSANLNLRKSRSPDFSPDERDAQCGDRVWPARHLMHGTEVASLIAGNGMDDVLGVNPEAHIVPVRLFGACRASRQDLLDAIAWSAGLPVEGVPDNPNPARIINLSLSGGFSVCRQDLQNLIDRVTEKNIFVVAAAGNSYQKTLREPANCKGVISVGALDAQNRIADYSALDPRTVIYAPGGGPALSANAQSSIKELKVASDERFLNGQYRSASPYGGAGTSYAAPIVAGYISLWLSYWPEKTNADFLNELDRFTRHVEPSLACSTCVPRGLASMKDPKAS
jgi:serine protease